MDSNEPKLKSAIDLERLDEYLYASQELENEEPVARYASESESDGGEVSDTPMAEENRLIMKNQNNIQFFCDVYLEMHDFQFAFEKSKELYTRALLNGGVTVNPQQVFSKLEMLCRRLTQVSVAKRMCHALGLHAEMDEIVRREMDIIYNTNTKEKAPAFDRSPVVAGEQGNRNG